MGSARQGYLLRGVVVHGSWFIDQILAEPGFIAANAVRSIKLEDVLVNPGATLLSLPAEIITALGLPVSGETSVKTSTDSIKTRIFREANLEINGRRSTFSLFGTYWSRDSSVGCFVHGNAWH